MTLFTSRLLPLLPRCINSVKLTTPESFPQIRNYAARKGTRERKTKKKVKTVVEKVGFIPHNQRNKEKLLAMRPKLKFDESSKSHPVDNVYCSLFYRTKVYPFVEAVQCHRETHHPDMYNKPHEDLHVRIELNMQGEKSTKFVDNFTRIVSIPHKFEHGDERTIVAFSKDEADLVKAREAGAQLAGGVELIKEVQNGKLLLSDFQFVVAHPNILPELVVLRGLMKKKFPNQRMGTLDVDFTGVVHRFLNGVNYSAVRDEYEKDFGSIETVIGTLDMNEKHLEENYSALIRDVYMMKPKREGDFIMRVLLWSPPSAEKLMVNYNDYLEKKAKDDVEDDEEVEQAAIL